uniref:Smad anchor for receptor activation-like C-terminal domain-containing protein n=3 Tax=Clytia hemisphaerica TaxID=252671 RepID=A0A7M5XFZ6_9CNID
GSASSDAPPYSELSPSSPTNQFTEQPAPILPAGVQGMGDVLPGNAGRNPHLTGAQLTEMMNFQLPAYTPTARQRQNRNRTESEMSAVIMFNSTATNLPPIIRRSNEETRIVNNPDLDTLFSQIRDEQEDPITFIVNKNLVVRVKIVNLDCCVEKKCWCFTSDGMGASNQEEIVVLIKCGSYDVDDRTLTRKVLQQMNHIFEKAKHGHPVSDLEQLEYDASLCCTPKNVAMLFFKHSLQCIKKLIIPTSPYLFGMYIEKSELPWAKNFPLRLLLRVGAEYKYYPCPLLNILDRPAVYDGVGRTILDLLADFRNFQYTIPRVVGVTINLRGKDTIIRLPQHRYDEIMKAVNSCEENVLSLAGNFSTTCDGHLVAVEKDGRYKTQTLSIVLKANRKVTCASFVVISAALKANQDGVKAKASIVEDGVMVQVTPEVMKEFKQAIKDMKEFSFGTGESSSASGGATASGGDEVSSKVGIEWSSADVMDRPRLLSPIDGTSFDNLTNMKIRHSYDYTSNNLTAKIHWIEVYFLPQDSDTVQRLSARELGQMTSSVAKACMSALSAHLMTLLALDMTRIGLRVNLAADFVEYKIGANLSTLPAELLPGLDDKLVPAIHTVMSSAQERVAVELIFQVVKIV